MTALGKILGAVVLFVLILGMGVYAYYNLPYDDRMRPVHFVVPEGATLGQTAESLEGQGVIRFSLIFGRVARLIGKDRSIQAGEYTLHTSMTPREVLQRSTFEVVVWVFLELTGMVFVSFRTTSWGPPRGAISLHRGFPDELLRLDRCKHTNGGVACTGNYTCGAGAAACTRYQAFGLCRLPIRAGLNRLPPCPSTGRGTAAAQQHNHHRAYLLRSKL